MFRRWLIRTCFLLPLMVCLALWVFSCFATFNICYDNHERMWDITVINGQVSIDTFNDSGLFTDDIKSWHWWIDMHPSATAKRELGVEPVFMGFRFGPQAPLRSSMVVVVPFWFLTLVFCFL